ncbi:MAG: isoleucine--tRNA ligase [Thermoplasmata archaeon]
MHSEASPSAVPSLVDVHRTVLDFWERNDLARALAAGREDGPEFRFTEGPPTANGAPHIGHLISRALKDVQLRYRRMTGHRIVSPMAGWDCHGLPVELEIEKKHGLKSRVEIESYGVEKFCEECRRGALEVAGAWREMSRQLGYWLDYDRAYFTMSPAYIESVWWSLKTLFDRRLLEKGYYVLPYCPRCETTLSSHEVAQGYAETTDPSVVVRVRLSTSPKGVPRDLLVWTTTPWTLPANLLIAARSDLTYVVLRTPEGTEEVVAEAAAGRYGTTATHVTDRLTGAQLEGLAYEPLFPFAGPGPGRFRVVLDAMVDPTEGTGLVHIAPSFGPDDQRVGEREGVGAFDPLDSRGVFDARVPPVAGRSFKAADPILLDDLARRGRLAHRGTIQHTYPFCWRCRHALLYRAIDSWFVRTSRFTTALRTNNATVLWVPAHLRDGRFGNFLAEAKDWALSRSRYWGTPLPVWICPSGHVTCIGSFRELAERSGHDLPANFDPHRVTVDRIHFPCPQCAAPTRREPYTIDGWYDSGSAPFAQYHYPFEPGPFLPDAPLDYVAEGLDQTRGWFYTLLVLATALFDRPAYRACLSNGLVLDDSGQKMSKSRGKAIEPLGLLERQGADAVRWGFFLIDFTEPMRVTEAAIRQAGARTLGTLLNVAEFYRQNTVTLPNAGEATPHPTGVLDRWLLSRVDATIATTRASLDAFDPRRGALALRHLIDDVSTWYLRRSRPRFWSEEATEDRSAASATLGFGLVTLARLTAPFTPFVAEQLYQTVTGATFGSGERSVHREPFPVSLGTRDEGLELEMDRLRELVEMGRELRQRAQVRSRIPLETFVIVGTPPFAPSTSAEGEALLRDELNVRAVQVVPSVDLLRFPENAWVRREEGGEVRALLSRSPTPELYREGLVREVLRRLQLERKARGLRYTDRITLTVYAPDPIGAAIQGEGERIARELLADPATIVVGPPPSDGGVTTWEVEGITFGARLERRNPRP